ncbi:hypothetical protein [Cognatilysobacter lacus]|uniref:Uncharacterized protein n=1 Tax=Cognatilysobacter lacus TaxID=1643323 RepID=A0A5D8Z6U4_9GAMM|nr:hypothetical protein [Lysobacter lacus]TZF90397.1 hypothetical protein FW784_05440 [Lysobacter lacus]
MHETYTPRGDGLPPHYTGHWRHDMANEVNALTMATSAARHMLQLGDVQSAMLNLARAEDAAMRCSELLRFAPSTR